MATMECAPTGSVVVVKVAWPLPFSVALPTDVRSDRKTTVPSGVPDPLVTVAVKVTDPPRGSGFGDTVTVVVVGASKAKAEDGAIISAAMPQNTEAVIRARVGTNFAIKDRKLAENFTITCPRTMPRQGFTNVVKYGYRFPFQDWIS